MDFLRVWHIELEAFKGMFGGEWLRVLQQSLKDGYRLDVGGLEPSFDEEGDVAWIHIVAC